MDILILGNGFDLVHGLKTKYSDFLKYYKEKYTTTIGVGVDKSDNFLSNNVWAKHFLNKTPYGDKWIDLEKEIYRVIVKLSKLPYFKNKNSYENYKKIAFLAAKDDTDFNFDNFEYFRECPTLIARECYNVSIKDFIEFLYNQLQEFTKEFKKYLIEETKKLQNPSKYVLRLNSDCISLLNFNYTDTCEQLYKINFNYCSCGIKTKAVYVHGKINNDDNCNLVLGTHSFNNEQIPIEFNIFKKHHQRHRYGTIEQYQELLNELKYPKKIYTSTFHIVGHSLDETDHNILKHILLAKERSIINIYYHDEEALARMQSNIDLIIGEEEVMAKVRFIPQHDPKRGILIPKENIS